MRKILVVSALCALSMGLMGCKYVTEEQLSDALAAVPGALAKNEQFIGSIGDKVADKVGQRIDQQLDARFGRDDAALMARVNLRVAELNQSTGVTNVAMDPLGAMTAQYASLQAANQQYAAQMAVFNQMLGNDRRDATVGALQEQINALEGRIKEEASRAVTNDQLQQQLEALSKDLSHQLNKLERRLPPVGVDLPPPLLPAVPVPVVPTVGATYGDPCGAYLVRPAVRTVIPQAVERINSCPWGCIPPVPIGPHAMYSSGYVWPGTPSAESQRLFAQAHLDAIRRPHEDSRVPERHMTVSKLGLLK